MKKALSSVMVLLFVMGCNFASPSASSAAETDLNTVYTEALDYTSNPAPDNIYNKLNAISSANSSLQWTTMNGEQYVLVTTLGPAKYYTSSLNGFYNMNGYYAWVAAVPQMKNICSASDFGTDDFNLRLRQLLGLAPTTTEELSVMEFYVRPADMFRPCPDSEIDDTSCGLNWPDSVPAWYRKWLNKKRATTYVHDGATLGTPFTQLGYTYDWGNLDNPVGVSEYVIKSDASIYVNSITAPRAYCGKK